MTTASSLAIWRRYERWNAALALVAEEHGAGGRPLYLELDDEVLQAAAGHLEEEVSDPRAELISHVRATMDIGPQAAPLTTHAERTRRWRPHSGQAPPCLGLLYVCSAAAMAMRAGDGMDSRNYYGRLAAILGFEPTDVPEIARGYRNHAEALWDALNQWLEYHEGEKGLPTAFALRHRYAGLPMSQALVRRADRARLSQFFAAYGLPPNGQITPADLEPVLDDWITSNPPPVSLFLRELWKGTGQARERIAGIVSLELAEWDGSTDLPVSDARRSGTLRVVAKLRKFPVRKLELDLSVRLGHDADEATLDVLDATGAVVRQAEFLRAGDGSLTLASADDVDATALIAGFTRLRGASTTGERKPRLLVPLRRDDLLQAYVETDRLQLGETSMLLVPVGRQADVSAALTDCAAPGWQAVESLAGLPEDWVLFTGVEIFAPIDRAKHRWVELEALVPLGATQLTLAGGLRLPTKLRKWSTFRPPEIRAVLPNAQSAEVTVHSLGGDSWQATWASTDGVILVDLGEVGLEDGDYTAQLRIAGKRQAVAEAILRLRSADTQNRTASVFEIGYGLTGVEAFSAVENGQIQGASTGHSSDTCDDESAPLPPPRLEALVRRRVHPHVAAPAKPLVLGDVADDSCVATGAHRIDLPMVTGNPTRGWIQGTCRTCGLVKRYPASHAQARRRTTRSNGSRSNPVDLTRLRPVHQRDEVDWQLGFDALCHLGRGNATALERIGLQLESSKLFVDTFTRTLECLGHLDVQRNARTWRTEAWQVPPPVLVKVGPTAWFLSGWRSERLVHQVGLEAAQRGADVTIETTDSAPDAVWLRGANDSLADEICDKVNVDGHRLRLVANAPQRLLSAVPPLAKIAATLPRVSRGEVRKVETWDPDSASWIEESQPRSGFLRLHGAVQTYCMITREDMAAGLLRPMTPQLLKHVAAVLSKRPLIAWDPEQQILAVPKGCDLPGLIGRAATLCSGRPPRFSEDGQALVYADVSERVARAINKRLGGR